MPVVPAPPLITGGVLTTTELAALAAAISFLQNPPIFQGRSNTNQSLTTGVWASAALQVTDVDQNQSGVAGHSNSVNNSRYTAQYPGWHRCGGNTGVYGGNATGRRGSRLAVNGTSINASKQLVGASVATGISIACASSLVYLNVGDFVEIQAFQDTGGALTIGSATIDDNSNFTVVWESD